MRKYIDMTPRWAELLPTFLLMIESGTPESKSFAKSELARALQALDAFIEREKAEPKAPEPIKLGNDLIEAYLGYYEDELLREYAEATEGQEAAQAFSQWAHPRAELKARLDPPAERLRVYLGWNGIIGYAQRAFEIANGEG